MRTLAAAFLLLMSACDSNQPAATPASKSLFSSWALQGPNASIFDLTGCKIGSQAYRFRVADYACDCVLGISGTEDAGTIVITSCAYNSLGNGGADPGTCANADKGYRYTKTTDTLTVCRSTDPTNCETYK